MSVAIDCGGATWCLKPGQRKTPAGCNHPGGRRMRGEAGGWRLGGGRWRVGCWCLSNDPPARLLNESIHTSMLLSMLYSVIECSGVFVVVWWWRGLWPCGSVCCLFMFVCVKVFCVLACRLAWFFVVFECICTLLCIPVCTSKVVFVT